MKGSNYHSNRRDRIIGKRIIIHDRCDPHETVLKEVEIIKKSGEVRHYKIIRTSKGRYLFN